MLSKFNAGSSALRFLLLTALGATVFSQASARPTTPRGAPKAIPLQKSAQQDDSFMRIPAKDLLLSPENERKAGALTDFVEGTRLEEMAELEGALKGYQKVLNVDPGFSDLASRVASLLARQEDFPRAIDVLKDAIKANPKEPAPYLQLALIYAKYLKKTDQAVKYANQAVTLDPQNIEAYQRLYEIELSAGNPAKALAALDRAKAVKNDDSTFWTRLGKLYASIVFKSDTEPKPDEIKRVNEIFNKAVEAGKDDAGVLKEVADYYAASQQTQEAIPLYLRVLELQPDDSNAREKLATGFVLTNQRAKAIEMLQEIIKQHPEKYQSYDLLAQLYDDEGRAFQRSNQSDKAKAAWVKSSENYEQSLLINGSRAGPYIRLGELLIGPVKKTERGIKVIGEARQRFPGVPEFSYLLALALREGKQAQAAVPIFEEALHEAEAAGSEMANAHFYFDYGATAEQAGLYDKAADLFRQSIALDPTNAAEAYNYLGYMWAEHNMHLDEAADMIHRALELDPNNGAYLDSLGWINFRRGKFDDALNDLLRAAQNIAHDDPVVFEHIGDAYAKLNRMPQALDYWQKAIALTPENKSLVDKIEHTKTKISKGPSAQTDPVR